MAKTIREATRDARAYAAMRMSEREQACVLLRAFVEFLEEHSSRSWVANFRGTYAQAIEELDALRR